MSDPSKIEIAQLETLATVSSSTRVLVQDGVAGTPYRQTTVGNLIAGLVDDIGVGTIVAGTVVIAAGTADLDVLSSTTADFGTVSIGGGTGTLSSLGVSGLVSGGTVTAGIGSFTTLNAGTVDLSSGKMVVATGSVTTLTATTGTVTALNTGTLTATGGTATLASGTITALNTGTLTATGGTAALSSGTITSATASTLAVSGTGTVGTLVANAGTVTLGKGTITDAAAATLAVSGTATAATLVGTVANITTLTATTGTVTTFNSPTLTATTGTMTDVIATNATLAVVTGNDSISFTGGGTIEGGPVPVLSPGWATVWMDPSRRFATGIRKDGSLKAQAGTIEIASMGTLTLSSSLTVPSATITDATIAGDQIKSSSFVPGWATSYSDANGKLAGGIRKSGVLQFKAAQFDSVTIADSGSALSQSLIPGVLTSDEDSAGYVARGVNRSGLLLARPRVATIARASRQIARPTNIHTYIPPRTSSDDAVSSGTTIATLWTADFDFDYIRICLGQQANNSITAKAVIAPTATANDGVNPLDESGSAQAWTTVLFNNGGSPDYEPWNQNTGATSSISMNGSTETQVWGLTYSDWMQVSSLAQTGGSTRPLVMVRVYLTGTPVAINMSSTNMFGLTPTSYTYGRTWAGYTASGDYVTSTSGYPSSGTSWGDRWAPLFIQTYSRKFGIQTWGCGDSNMAGTGSTGGFMSFLRRSVLRTGVNYPVVMGNFNQAGSSPEIYMSNVENILGAVKPSILVMFPFSFNMSATRANLDTYWARAMNLVARVNAYGGVPILVGYPPRGTATSGDDAIRALSLERLEYARASGIRVVDPNPFVATNDDPAQWVAGMSDDDTHFNNESYGRLADLLSVEMLDAIGA